MKIAFAFIGLLLLTACEGNHSSPPDTQVVSPAPVPAGDTNDETDTQTRDWKTLNDGLPNVPSDLGPSEPERKFVQAAREYIAALKLPAVAPFEKKSDDDRKAKLFVGLRCSSMLRKMKSAPKSFTNLYSEDELSGVCSAKDVRLYPGQSVSSFKTSGLLFSKDRTSIEIAVRSDYTVSGYRISTINDSILSSLKATETIATIDGDRRIRSFRSGEQRSIEVAEASGRIAYSEQETYVSQTRDGSLRKTLIARGMRDGRTLMVREATITPAPGFLGRRREKTNACVVQMLNPDGTIYSQAHESSLCFAARPTFL